MKGCFRHFDVRRTPVVSSPRGCNLEALQVKSPSDIQAALLCSCSQLFLCPCSFFWVSFVHVHANFFMFMCSFCVNVVFLCPCNFFYVHVAFLCLCSFFLIMELLCSSRSLMFTQLFLCSRSFFMPFMFMYLFMFIQLFYVHVAF